MNKELINIFLIQILILAEIIFVLMFIVKLNRTLKHERRIVKFSVQSEKEKEISYLDKASNILSKITSKFAKNFKKYAFFQKTANKYEKYLLENPNKDKIEYLIIRYAIALILGMIVLIVTRIQNMEHSIIYTIIAILIGYQMPKIYWNNEYNQYQFAISQNTLEAIIIVNSSIRNGSTINEAIFIATKQLNGPISLEYKKINHDITYGLAIDQAFARFYQRIPNQNNQYISQTLTFYKKINGDVNQAFEQIEKKLYEMREERNNGRLIDLITNVLTRIFCSIPIAVFTIFLVFKKTYTEMWFNQIEGFLILSIILLFYLIYLFQVRKARAIL